MLTTADVGLPRLSLAAGPSSFIVSNTPTINKNNGGKLIISFEELQFQKQVETE